MEVVNSVNVSSTDDLHLLEKKKVSIQETTPNVGQRPQSGLSNKARNSQTAFYHAQRLSRERSMELNEATQVMIDIFNMRQQSALQMAQ